MPTPKKKTSSAEKPKAASAAKAQPKDLKAKKNPKGGPIFMQYDGVKGR